MIFAHRCGSFRAHPFAIAAGVCLVLLIVASCVVFKQRRPELFAKAIEAAEEKLRTAMVDAGRKEIDLATEGKDIAKRLAEANVVAVATDGLGGVAAVGTGAADVLTKGPTENHEMVVGAATDLLTKKDKEEEDDKAASPTEDLEKDDDDDDEARAAADQAAEDEAEEEERKTFWESVQTKFKILIAVYQIQNALPWTLPFVSYPDAFEALVSWMSVWKSTSEFSYLRNIAWTFVNRRAIEPTRSRGPPRHRADAVTGTTSRRWPGNTYVFTGGCRSSNSTSCASSPWNA